MPVKQSEAAMSPEQRRREVAALLGLAVRRLAKRPGASIANPHDDGAKGRATTLARACGRLRACAHDRSWSRAQASARSASWASFALSA